MSAAAGAPMTPAPFIRSEPAPMPAHPAPVLPMRSAVPAAGDSADSASVPGVYAPSDLVTMARQVIPTRSARCCNN